MPNIWSGPTGRHCVICGVDDLLYVCMLIILKDNKGEKITRMIEAQWILCIFEATHLEAQANRVKMTPSVDPWGYATMGWVKNRMTEKYQAMKANGNMIAKEDKIKSWAASGKIDSKRTS
jgi:hypothetical protein